MIPIRRLNQKTSADKVEKQTKGIAKAECNSKTAEVLKVIADDEAEGREDRQEIARAETYRPNHPQASNGTTRDDFEDLFEPSFHPEAASSDGRERRWYKVGKSVVLVLAKARSETDTKETTRPTATRQDTAKAETDKEAGETEQS